MSTSFEVKYPQIKVSQDDRIRCIGPGDSVMAPSKCIVCGSIIGSGKVLIDFGYSIQFYGRVQFCNVCIAQAMSAFGWVDTKGQEYTEFVKDVEKLKEYNAKLMEENLRLKDYEVLITRIRNSSAFNGFDIPTLESDIKATADANSTGRSVRQDNSINEKSVSSEVSRTSTPGKQDDGERPASIRNITTTDVDEFNIDF